MLIYKAAFKSPSGGFRGLSIWCGKLSSMNKCMENLVAFFIAACSYIGVYSGSRRDCSLNLS
jgi:hypothetical protein